MDNKYIKDAQKSELDDEINKLFSQLKDGELGGSPMLIAIQNKDGQVYREIITYGLSSYLDVVQSLPDLGFRDLYKDDVSPNRFDSMFVHP